MKVGILGSGDVGRTLAAGCLKHDHTVMIGTRTPEKLVEWGQRNPKGHIGSFDETAKFAELVVLAVKGTVAREALLTAGVANLTGKIAIDATNPIADAPPVNGVLKFFTDLNESLMERLQREFEGARFVKAFNSVGSACMVNPQFKGGPPTMFVCGNVAKETGYAPEHTQRFDCPSRFGLTHIGGFPAELCENSSHGLLGSVVLERAASVADGDTQEVPVDTRSRAPAEPIGVSSGRGPH
jgi:8-hydroxy-5-deazaflavin:NADPH oxidoreductase